MHQVLFRIPLRVVDGLPGWLPDSVPIYGYGAMLFLAFVACTWWASRRAQQEGIAKEHLQDLALWLVIGGIAGARSTFMIQYHVPPADFFKIWQGGLVFYGSAIGGAVAFALAYRFILRKHQLSALQIGDIIAPCVAIGLALGRVGCLLNGCCYGNVVAGEHCPAIHFPLSAPSRLDPENGLVGHGFQTAAGFTSAETTLPPRVDQVDPHSPAYASGLRDGDVILSLNGQPLRHLLLVRDTEQQGAAPVEHAYDTEESYQQALAEFAKSPRYRVVDDVSRPLSFYLCDRWERGRTDLTLDVRHADGRTAQVGPFYPETLGLHPTQVYETISMVLLFFLLLAFLPFRRRYGEVFALWMICYALHRFLNEMLRNDTDPVAFGMTLSQNLSILCLLGGVAWFVWLRRQPAQLMPGDGRRLINPSPARAAPLLPAAK